MHVFLKLLWSTSYACGYKGLFVTTLWGDASHGTEELSHVYEGMHMENDAQGQGKDTR